MKKMTRAEAENYLYELWQNGEIPNNFTFEHTEYETAIKQLTKKGSLDFSQFFPPEYEINSPNEL